MRLQIHLKPTGSEQQACAFSHENTHTHKLWVMPLAAVLLGRCEVHAWDIYTGHWGKKSQSIEHRPGWENSLWFQYDAPLFKFLPTATSCEVTVSQQLEVAGGGIVPHRPAEQYLHMILTKQNKQTETEEVYKTSFTAMPFCFLSMISLDISGSKCSFSCQQTNTDNMTNVIVLGVTIKYVKVSRIRC